MKLLEQVMSGKTPAPRRVMLYGTHGVGKSTFAVVRAQADLPPDRGRAGGDRLRQVPAFHDVRSGHEGPVGALHRTSTPTGRSWSIPWTGWSA